MEPLPPSSSAPPVLAHLRSLLSAASSALSSLPSPLRSTSTITTTISTSSLPLTTPLPPLPSSPTSEIRVPLPGAPAPYSDCPAVVRTTAPPPASFSLPAFLAAECADFSSSTSTVPALPSPPRILPSELCLLQREVGSWASGGHHHLPGAYSYAAARVAAALRLAVPRWEAELQRWVLASSPRYGVVIDAVTRDHVIVLVRLCLKAAATEAGCSLEREWKRDISGCGFDPRASRFECPRLLGGVSWLAAQLAVLFGEGNGRSFAVATVKEAILMSGSCLAVGLGGGRGGEAGTISSAGTGSGLGDFGAVPVFVSQVAAAITALHERSALETKIRALQAPRPSKYQLLLEYSQIVERGHEERSKRPNYRAVLEYDGILSRRAETQNSWRHFVLAVAQNGATTFGTEESGRSKTQEELLAEERDYKRRRMSYRGKKMKRNPTEILKDIIDYHMEDIKQAGRVDCLVEAPGDIAQDMLKSNSQVSRYEGDFDPISSSFDKAVLGSLLPSRETSPHTNSLGRIPSRSRDTRNSYLKSRSETRGHHYKNVPEHENTGRDESESAMDRSYSDKHENSRHKRSSSDRRKYDDRYKTDRKDISEYHSESSDCTPWSTRTPKSSGKEYHRTLGDRTKTSQSRHRSVPANQDEFSDRYDPQSRYSDEDPPASMHYDVGNHEVYHDEIHPREPSQKKRDHSH